MRPQASLYSIRHVRCANASLAISSQRYRIFLFAFLLSCFESGVGPAGHAQQQSNRYYDLGYNTAKTMRDECLIFHRIRI